MCNLICMFGMVLAALFMIIMFGPERMDTVVHPAWVDFTFLGKHRSRRRARRYPVPALPRGDAAAAVDPGLIPLSRE